MFITQQYLRSHPDHVFVYGDNSIHRGYKGAAALRTEPNTYGFVTKKYPSSDHEAFYHPKPYRVIYSQEIQKLKAHMLKNPGKLYLISQLGAGLANRFGIFQKVIEPNIKTDLAGYNVKFLW